MWNIRKISILLSASIVSTIGLAQAPKQFIQADIALIGTANYKYKSLEFAYAHRDGNTNYYFFELTDFNLSRVSSVGISRLQQKYALGIGYGEYIRKKILDIIQYRYDVSLGYGYYSIPVLPENNIFPEKHKSGWGPYARFANTFSYQINSKLASYFKITIPLSLQKERTTIYDPFIIPKTSSTFTDSNSSIRVLVHFGIQYSI